MILPGPRLPHFRTSARECRAPLTVSYRNQVWRTARHEAGHIVGGLDGGLIPLYAIVGKHSRIYTGGVGFRSSAPVGVSGWIAYLTMYLAAFYAENTGPFAYARLHHKGRWNYDAKKLHDVLKKLPGRVADRAYLVAHMRALGLMTRRRVDILRIAKRLQTKRLWRP